jgi:hypothetical protein
MYLDNVSSRVLCALVALREVSLRPTMRELMKSIAILLIGFLLVFQMQRIPRGLWGGPHISITVGAKSATVEYDCASGVIDGPLVVDSDGNFTLHGKHRMERGGPVRMNETPPEHPATYTGSIKGNTMTLNLKFDDSEVETFTLEKGKPGELFKCK